MLRQQITLYVYLRLKQIFTLSVAYVSEQRAILVNSLKSKIYTTFIKTLNELLDCRHYLFIWQNISIVQLGAINITLTVHRYVPTYYLIFMYVQWIMLTFLDMCVCKYEALDLTN